MSEQKLVSEIRTNDNGSVHFVNDRGGVCFVVHHGTVGQWDIGVQPDTGNEMLMRATTAELHELGRALTALGNDTRKDHNPDD